MEVAEIKRLFEASSCLKLFLQLYVSVVRLRLLNNGNFDACLILLYSGGFSFTCICPDWVNSFVCIFVKTSWSRSIGQFRHPVAGVADQRTPFTF